MKTGAILLLTTACGAALWAYALPFPQGNMVLASIQMHKPAAYWSLVVIWAGVLCTLPLYIILPVYSAVERIRPLFRREPSAGKLPPYPDPAERTELFAVIGEVHEQRKLVPSRRPTWLTIPAEGLYTGVEIIGASGAGKSTNCILPLAWQLFGYKAQDQEKKVGGLVLEVKGDLCAQIRQVLRSHGREDDLIELGFDSEWVYNPLQAPLSATALAFNMSTLERALYGEGKDSRFWTQASEALLSYLIEMNRILNDGYVTLYDLYKAACSLNVIKKLQADVEDAVEKTAYVLLERETYLNLPKSVHREVDRLKWDPAPPSHLRTRSTKELIDLLRAAKVPFVAEEESGSEEQEENRTRLEFERWNYEKLMHETEPTTRNNISIGVQVFLKPFVADPAIRRIFSPPQSVYEGKGQQQSRPLPPLTDLIESGKILALNIPKAADESAARSLGAFLKLDWQRAVELRVPKMQKHPEQHWRDLVWISDEYQIIATTGGARPGGDEKFLNLCRAAKCISIVAYQSLNALESGLAASGDWRTVFSAFQTKIFLRAGEPWTAKVVSDMAGKKIRALQHFGFTEGQHKARVSAVTGKLTAPESSVNVSHSYNLQKDLVFESCDVEELPRGVAIVFAHDGRRPVEPTYCYLKWIGANPNVGYYDVN